MIPDDRLRALVPVPQCAEQLYQGGSWSRSHDEVVSHSYLVGARRDSRASSTQRESDSEFHWQPANASSVQEVGSFKCTMFFKLFVAGKRCHDLQVQPRITIKLTEIIYLKNHCN